VLEGVPSVRRRPKARENRNPVADRDRGVSARPLDARSRWQGRWLAAQVAISEAEHRPRVGSVIAMHHAL